jgi:transglutaminase-like putative cysteine protease
MSDHVWTEVWNSQEKRWVHVDPSEKKIGDPEMYERDWKKDLKEVYALENGQVENVTADYKLHVSR